MCKILIYNYNVWITETNPTILNNALNKLLSISGYTVLGTLDHHFSPHGYTCMWLLAESHCAIHTFPEHNKTYIELSGCNDKMNSIFIDSLKKELHVIATHH